MGFLAKSQYAQRVSVSTENISFAVFASLARVFLRWLVVKSIDWSHEKQGSEVSSSVLVSKERAWCRELPPDTKRVYCQDESPDSTI